MRATILCSTCLELPPHLLWTALTMNHWTRPERGSCRSQERTSSGAGLAMARSRRRRAVCRGHDRMPWRPNPNRNNQVADVTRARSLPTESKTGMPTRRANQNENDRSAKPKPSQMTLPSSPHRLRRRSSLRLSPHCRQHDPRVKVGDKAAARPSSSQSGRIHPTRRSRRHR